MTVFLIIAIINIYYMPVMPPGTQPTFSSGTHKNLYDQAQQTSFCSSCHSSFQLRYSTKITSTTMKYYLLYIFYHQTWPQLWYMFTTVCTIFHIVIWSLMAIIPYYYFFILATGLFLLALLSRSFATAKRRSSHNREWWWFFRNTSISFTTPCQYTSSSSLPGGYSFLYNLQQSVKIS